jgi:hypothetical protein
MFSIAFLHVVFLALLVTFPVCIALQIRSAHRMFSGRFKWSRRPRVELRWIRGPDTIGTGMLPSGNYVIGRSPECHIHVNHSSVSQRHAVLMIRRRFTAIIDTDSLNGVRIESLPVPSWTRVRVPDAQTVFLGRDVAFEHRRRRT